MIGVLTSVVSVFFYLRVVVMMYMSDHRRGAGDAPVGRIALRAGGADRRDLLSRRAAGARPRNRAAIHRDDSLDSTARRSDATNSSFKKIPLRRLRLCGEILEGQIVSRNNGPQVVEARFQLSVQSQSEQAHGSSPLRSLQRDRACASCTLSRSKYSSQYGRSSSSGVVQ